MRYYNIFFADLKLYLWSIHMANNLILATSFGFKLNSNLKPLIQYMSIHEKSEKQMLTSNPADHLATVEVQREECLFRVL